MPTIVQPMDLGANAFSFTHRYETRNENWLMLHAHQGIELLYIHEGSGTVTLESQQYKLEDNMLFCFQPYQLHKVDVPLKEGATYIRTNLTFDARILDPYLQPYPKMQAFLRRLMYGLLRRQVFTFCEDKTLANLLSDYDKMRTLTGGEPSVEDRVLFLLSLIKHLQLHVFESGDTHASMDKNSGHVEKILDWIETHYRQTISLESLSRELHLSSYHISHLFKQQTGMTISDYVAGRRIREACALLENTDYSINEIGRMIGGFSAPYFSQLFKRHKGVTPHLYRSAIKHTYR
ncbi:AraC family transcriptional regulator [Paenibacillus sp. JDR-2]|uniref:AraC family transcriptional regulator n=1 Tax=Paenibacillus sp. (strain JDR-2) TaxID=324057 RepID=UPI0001666D6D|nr:AraC family transcriptional regulator [Paenibacillus sp. JDR-2]ACT01235.1 transcriptional regulator, AraC family [Paenibacillus sp. JDR-2]